MKSKTETRKLRAALLAWYDNGGRTLPWRIRPEDRAAGITPDPYAVWLSEIMLQQTTVPHATPYWGKFLAEFPTVTDLAAAPRDRVLTLWAGLGYYARARNLHKCAEVVSEAYGGAFPGSEAQLLKLPGIGAYSAAAIASICFNEATNVVDGNVERVISRMFAVKQFLPKAKKELRDLAGTLSDPKRPGDYAQAIMDLGATVCKPKNPKCDICVWSFACDARTEGAQETYPRKMKKAKLPVRYGAAFYLKSESGKVLLSRRADAGLLGGMMEFPGTDWTGEKSDEADWMAQAPAKKNWEYAGEITHVFTHFRLYIAVYRASGDAKETPGDWTDADDLKSRALPSVMVKVAKQAAGGNSEL